MKRLDLSFCTPREPLAWFARVMEKCLRENDHKPGWQSDTLEELLERLEEEVDELKSGRLSNEDVIREAADVANFAMMIADNARRSGR